MTVMLQPATVVAYMLHPGLFQVQVLQFGHFVAQQVDVFVCQFARHLQVLDGLIVIPGSSDALLQFSHFRTINGDVDHSRELMAGFIVHPWGDAVIAHTDIIVARLLALVHGEGEVMQFARKIVHAGLQLMAIGIAVERDADELLASFHRLRNDDRTIGIATLGKHADRRNRTIVAGDSACGEVNDRLNDCVANQHYLFEFLPFNIADTLAFVQLHADTGKNMVVLHIDLIGGKRLVGNLAPEQVALLIAGEFTIMGLCALVSAHLKRVGSRIADIVHTWIIAIDVDGGLLVAPIDGGGRCPKVVVAVKGKQHVLRPIVGSSKGACFTIHTVYHIDTHTVARNETIVVSTGHVLLH